MRTELSALFTPPFLRERTTDQQILKFRHAYLAFHFLEINAIKPVLTRIFVANDKIGLSKEKNTKNNYIHHRELRNRDFFLMRMEVK